MVEAESEGQMPGDLPGRLTKSCRGRGTGTRRAPCPGKPGKPRLGEGRGQACQVGALAATKVKRGLTGLAAQREAFGDEDAGLGESPRGPEGM